jgi:hypothetical protein
VPCIVAAVDVVNATLPVTPDTLATPKNSTTLTENAADKRRDRYEVDDGHWSVSGGVDERGCCCLHESVGMRRPSPATTVLNPRLTERKNQPDRSRCSRRRNDNAARNEGERESGGCRPHAMEEA